jgi:hypothetical protein
MSPNAVVTRRALIVKLTISPVEIRLYTNPQTTALSARARRTIPAEALSVNATIRDINTAVIVTLAAMMKIILSKRRITGRRSKDVCVRTST